MSEPITTSIIAQRQRVIDAARLAARLRGCTCSAQVRLHQLGPGVYTAEMIHACDCSCDALDATGGGR